MKKLKTCIRCGREFKPASNAQKYCRVCASEMYWPAKKIEEEKEKSIGRLNEQARAAGMSYGQYVALLQTKKRKEQNNEKHRL